MVRAASTGRPAPDADADSGGDPDRGGGGEAADGVAADEDEPGAQEPDPGHDLRGHPGRVEDDQPGLQHVGEPVLADQHEQRRADPDQGVGAQPGVLLPDLPLQADRRGQDQGQAQLGGLPPALAVERGRLARLQCYRIDRNHLVRLTLGPAEDVSCYLLVARPSTNQYFGG